MVFICLYGGDMGFDSFKENATNIWAMLGSPLFFQISPEGFNPLDVLNRFHHVSSRFVTVI